MYIERYYVKVPSYASIHMLLSTTSLFFYNRNLPPYISEYKKLPCSSTYSMVCLVMQ